MIKITSSPRIALRILEAGVHEYALRSLRITAVIPSGKLPDVAGVINGRFMGMDSLVSIRDDATGALVEDIRPEWVTEVEII